MSEISVHIPHCMLYKFQLGNNTSTAARHICAAFGESDVVDHTCRDRFKWFHVDDKPLENRPWAGSPL